MTTNSTDMPEAGLGPNVGPFTNPSLQANLFFRVFLGILANFCCWVPMRLLWRNGEFAAAVFCMTTMVLNVFYVVNSLIWQNEDTDSWWLGYGWCDIQIYLFYALETLYTACVFEIMRQLANKVAISRATALNHNEKRRQCLVSALIIFPVPLLQISMTWFVLNKRYGIGPLIGCLSHYDPTLPYLICFVIPPPILTIGAAVFAGLTWKRFREVDKINRSVLHSDRSEQAMRQSRVRRKLYFLTLSILLPYFVVQFLFLVSNITSQPGWTRPYDYVKIHDNAPPTSWGRIDLILSDQLDFASMNMSYVPILTVIPLFVSFGATKEAINTYRRYLVTLGFAKIWLSLTEEYDPDRRANPSTRSPWSQTLSSIRSRNKGSPTSSQQTTLTGRSDRPDSDSRSKNGTSGTASVQLDNITKTTSSSGGNHGNLWPDLSGQPIPPPRPLIPHRNPWLFRTTFDYPVDFPAAYYEIFSKSKKNNQANEKSKPTRQSPKQEHKSDFKVIVETEGHGEQAHHWTNTQAGSRVQTRVWSDEHDDVNSQYGHHDVTPLRAARGRESPAIVRVDTNISRSSTMGLRSTE